MCTFYYKVKRNNKLKISTVYIYRKLKIEIIKIYYFNEIYYY